MGAYGVYAVVIGQPRIRSGRLQQRQFGGGPLDLSQRDRSVKRDNRVAEI